jgi:bifunctional enzyme CysN/CysC
LRSRTTFAAWRIAGRVSSARDLHAADDLHFIEIHVDTPIEVCEQRDPKGLYARARAGELEGMTGIDAPYQPPTQPDLVIQTSQQTVDQAVEQVMQALAGRLLHPPRGANGHSA